jgi:hypothetical protein
MNRIGNIIKVCGIFILICVNLRDLRAMNNSCLVIFICVNLRDMRANYLYLYALNERIFWYGNNSSAYDPSQYSLLDG